MKALDAPRKATIHIQKIAPGPPKAMAMATPAMLPTPTRLDSERDNAWNGDTPASERSWRNIRRSMSGNARSWMKRVRTLKYRPVSRHSTTR